MIYLAALLFFIALGIYRGKSKLVMFGLFAIVMFISVNFHSGFDISNYQNTYEGMSVDYNNAEERSLLFSALMLLLKLGGLSFYHFRIFCFLLWGTAVFLLATRFSKYPTFVIACCAMFPVLSFASQLRNGVAAAFVLFAIYTLLRRRDKLGVFLYTVLIVIAGLFHYAAFIYLFGLLAYIRIPLPTLRTGVVTVLLVTLAIGASGIIQGLVADYVGPYYADKYLAGIEGFSPGHHVPLIIGIVLGCLFSRWSYRVCRHHASRLGREKVFFARFVYRFSLLFLAAIPLLFLSSNFYRIFQNVFILPIISAANASSVYFVKKTMYQGVAFRLVFVAYYFYVTAFYAMWQGEFFSFYNSVSF